MFLILLQKKIRNLRLATFSKKAVISKGLRHLKPTETFQYTHFSSCHVPGVKKGFIKSQALRLLRTNSSKAIF